jgi:16S rRNA (uracil1498-N3)-methyltransferase
MTRRRFYAPQVSFASDGKSATLSADEARHAQNVLRLVPGDEVFVFDGEGCEYRGAIGDATSRTMTVDLVEQVEPAKPESPLDLTLGVALLKSEKFDLVVQKACELGVTRIVPLVTDRADVKIREPEDARRKLERWQRIALESAKQCGRARLMKIAAPTKLADALGDLCDAQLNFFFAERSGQQLGKHDLDAESVAALIGPEGGWTDDEIQQARTSGWKIITLGGRTLRAETAAIAVAALLQHRIGDLR